MPLVNLVTDLKSLKYGKDTPGGGYSGQPYIQAKIPDGLEPKSADFILRGGYLTVGDSLTDIKRLTKMFFDLKSPNGLFFIAKQNVLSNSAVRTQTSGILNEGIYTPLNTLAQAGVIAFGGHLDKQGINPFAQTGAYAVGNGLYNSVVKPSQPLEENRLVSLFEAIDKNEAVRNWNFSGVSLNLGDNNVLSYRGGPGSILGIGTTNIRFADKRTGNNNSLKVSNPGYFYGKNQQRSVDINNEQVGGLKVEPFKSWTWGGPDISTPYANYPLSNFLPNFDLNKPQSGSLSIVPQGPLTWTPQHSGSTFNAINLPKILSSGSSAVYQNLAIKAKGVNANAAKINNDFDHTQVNVYTQGNTWPETNNDLLYANNTFTYNQVDLINQPETKGKSTSSPKTQDFRAILRNSLQSTQKENATKSGATPKSLSYDIGDRKTIEYRVNLGDPGARANNDYSSYTRGVVGPGRTDQPLDKINALQVYSSNTGPIIDSSTNDLIAFRIGSINNSNPSIVSYIHFRAFLDSFTDSYTGDWNSMNYLGRGEKFYTYNGFDRKVSLSFTAAAQSKQELIPMYKKLNFLASNLAPDYSGDYGYMKGCFVTLTVGGYLYEQPGFITNLSYDMITEMPWEIGINDTNGDQDPSVKQLSHMIKINSFDFTPIHNFIPQKQSVAADGPTGPEQYIALANPNDGSTNWGLPSVNVNF
jgi:hypothetical protein